MRIATVDLGTNTVRLLVADATSAAPRWVVVEQDQRVTRLGEALTATGSLLESAAARTADAVAGYIERARRLGAERIVVVATSAVREAANGAEFAARLEQRTGAPVRVVSGADEARLSLAGIRHGLGALPGVTLAFDIGGGSTEYILARDGVLGAAASLRLGVVPLAERYPFAGPVEPARYAAMAEEIDARLAGELGSPLADVRVDRLVGTAGTVTTLAALDLELGRYDPERVQGHVLERAAVVRQLERLSTLDVAGRARVPCLEPGRADLIIPGTAIVLATMRRYGCERLVVSDWGLREGILADVLAGEV